MSGNLVAHILWYVPLEFSEFEGSGFWQQYWLFEQWSGDVIFFIMRVVEGGVTVSVYSSAPQKQWKTSGRGYEELYTELCIVRYCANYVMTATCFPLCHEHPAVSMYRRRLFYEKVLCTELPLVI